MADAATLPILLRQLHLPTMVGVACCDEVLGRAAQHGWWLQQALATLCEYELSERKQRRLQRHLREARLPVGKTLTTFDIGTLDPTSASG